MPLLDHFHPPLSTLRHWEAFHSRWANAIADALNSDLLPPGYFAETQIHVGGRFEVDVAALDSEPLQSGDRAGASVATLPARESRSWVAPAASMVVPWSFPDRVEVLVFSGEAGPTLVAAVELVSPGNKDRPDARRAFAAKCARPTSAGAWA